MMEQNINRLFNRLAFLGYGSYEISDIVRDAAGRDHFSPADLAATLEKYVDLGAEYLQTYSK